MREFSTLNGYTVKDATARQNIDGLRSDLTGLINQETQTRQSDISNESNIRANTDNILKNQIDALASGSPLVATDTTEMTDTDRVYVNTTDGNWYYYDGEDWQSGGTYQSAEDSETLEQIKKDFYTKASDNFVYEVGTINSNNGTNGNNAQRIRINDYLDIDKYKLITIDSSYDINIFAYSDDNTNSYLGNTGWLTEKEYYTSNILDTYATTKYIRFIFRSHVERDMTLQDVINSSLTIDVVKYATNKDLEILDEKLIEETTVDGETIECSFVQGSISSNNGQVDRTRNDRIVDENFYEVSKIKSIICDDGYKILIANYSSNNTESFVNVTDWLSSPITSFTSNYVRIVVKKANEGNISPTEETNTKINLKEGSLKEYVLHIEKPIINSFCPNIIWQSRNITDTICPPFSKDYVKLSVENEFDRIIVYVRKTTDNYYVSIHDDTINTEARNLDGTVISQTISSNNQSLATLNSYDWGIKYGSKYAGMGVPMVEDVMKWASQYNIACTVHFSYGFTQSDAEDIFAMACKYGIVDNMIILPSNGMDFTRLGYFKELNDNISYYVGCTYQDLISNINLIEGLLTGKNDVYVQPYPWGTIVDNEYRLYAKKHNLKLYNSTVMSENDLFNVVGFNKGYSIIETANIKNIKTTVRNYVNE